MKGQRSRVKTQQLRHLSSENGIALVMALVFSAIALVVMAALLYILLTGTQTSGVQKRYETALDAGKGGLDVFYQLIGYGSNPFDSATSTALNFQLPALSVGSGGVDCLTAKRTLTRTSWPVACNNTTAINPSDPTTYDMRVDLGGFFAPAYRVYAKMVDTVQGNSATDLGGGGLMKGGVVSSSYDEGHTVSIPYLYTIEIDSESVNNPQERAKLSVLYQY